MSELNGGNLPSHVVKYLEKHEVDPSDLPENVLVALAGLSTREVEFLAFIGNELRNGRLDVEMIAKIH